MGCQRLSRSKCSDASGNSMPPPLEPWMLSPHRITRHLHRGRWCVSGVITPPSATWEKRQMKTFREFSEEADFAMENLVLEGKGFGDFVKRRKKKRKKEKGSNDNYG